MGTDDALAVFTIDADSEVPPFQQVHTAVLEAIASHRLVPGAKLPTVRALATHLGLATNTVASGYRSLEAAGIVEGRGRAGTFVRLDTSGDPIDVEARKIAIEAAHAFARIGVDRDRALALLSDAFRA